jgi:type I restriction enzyme S subunit
MNTKLLKQKILDLAIRGKLTQQLKSDGTAKDLLTQISDERKGTRSKKSGVILSEAQSAKSKDLGRIIPLDKSEAPFEIPANWEWVRLGDLMTKVGAGSTPTGGRNIYETSGIKFIRSQNVYNDGLRLDDVVFIKSEIHSQKLGSRVIANDMLLNITGASIGRCAIVPADFDEANVNQHVLILRLANPKVLKFVHIVITSQFVFNQIMGAQVGGTKEGLSAERAKALQIPLPPLAEQQRIVAKIEEAFTEIDAIEKNKELLKNHIKQTRQKILDLAIHGKLVPQNKSDEPASVLLERITRDNPHYEKIGVDNVPFEIPEKWCWCRLGVVFTHTTGKALKKSDSNGILKKYITTSNLYWNSFDFSEVRSMYFNEDELKKCTAKKGDLLICNGGDVGRAAIWNFDYDICFQNHISRLRPRGSGIDNSFYLYVIKYNKDKGNLNGKGVGITSLSANDLLSLVIPLPPFAEQGRIVAKIEELFYTLDQMERNLV